MTFLNCSSIGNSNNAQKTIHIFMHDYEIFIEEINPCGGEKHSQKTLIEAEAASPEAYVKENGRYPILETTTTDKGDVVIVTGDNQGTFVRYTFTE